MSLAKFLRYIFSKYRTITVFRDNELKDIKVKPTEWKGTVEHDDDILCAAVMKCPPSMIATGSYDGDIVIWSTVTEMVSKHISTRKKLTKTKEALEINYHSENLLYINHLICFKTPNSKRSARYQRKISRPDYPLDLSETEVSLLNLNNIFFY